MGFSSSGSLGVRSSSRLVLVWFRSFSRSGRRSEREESVWAVFMSSSRFLILFSKSRRLEISERRLFLRAKEGSE